MEEKQVGIELRKLINLIGREVSKVAKDIPEGNVTEMHVNIIHYLQKAGSEGVMQKDIEQAFTIRKSTASRILKLMEKNGVIERHGVDYDARLKRIVLTPKAMKHHKMMNEHAKELEQRITAGVSEEDLQVLFKVLAVMQKNLED